MKPVSDDLYRLCRSLRKSEHRYFHVYAHRNRRESPQYYQYYREIYALPSWDEAALEAALRPYPFFARRAVLKNQLYHKLLDALHLYHRERDAEEQIKRQLHQVYLLLTRDLPEQAERLLQRATRQLRDAELYNCWPEALRLHQMLIERHLRRTDQQAEITEWQNEHRRITALLTDEQHLKWCKIRAYQQHFYGTSDRLIPQETIEDRSTDTYMARADARQIMALQAFQDQDAGLAYQHNQLQLELLEHNLGRHRGVAARYLSVFYNTLIDRLQLGAYAELQTGLQKLRELPKQKAFQAVTDIEAKTFSWSFQLELNACLQRADFEGGYRLLRDLVDGLFHHYYTLDVLVRDSLAHLGGLFAFHDGDAVLALEFLIPIDQQRPDWRQPFYRYKQLLHLLAHYQHGNHRWLESALPTTRRNFRQCGISDQQPEYTLLDLLKQLVYHSPNSKQAAAWKAKFLETYSDESEMEKFLHLRRWLEKN